MIIIVFLNVLLFILLQLLLPIRKILVAQSKTICCSTVHFSGLLHPDNNYSVTSKRYAFTDIGVQTKIRFYDFLNKFQILNPLKKSVSTLLCIILNLCVIIHFYV